MGAKAPTHQERKSTMKHIVKEINIHTGITLEVHEFDDAAEAMEYALTMNEIMQATPIRYKFCNKKGEHNGLV